LHIFKLYPIVKQEFDSINKQEMFSSQDDEVENQKDKNNSEMSLIDLSSKKMLVGIIITFLLLGITSFLDWFSFLDGDSGEPFSVTEWNGSVKLYFLRIQLRICKR